MSWFRRAKDRINDKMDELMDDNEGFEILDDSDRALIERLFGDLSKASVAKQLAVGGVTGWCSGFLFRKVGRVAALAVGGGLILLQVANHQHWITVNWGRVDRRVNRAKRQLIKTSEGLPRVAKSAERFVRENMFLASAYAGGFLIGLAT